MQGRRTGTGMAIGVGWARVLKKEGGALEDMQGDKTEAGEAVRREGAVGALERETKEEVASEDMQKGRTGDEEGAVEREREMGGEVLENMREGRTGEEMGTVKGEREREREGVALEDIQEGRTSGAEAREEWKVALEEEALEKG